MKRLVFVAIAGVAALTLSSCGAGQAESAGGAKQNTVKVGVIPTTDTATVYIAQEEGFFADEGLTVETQIIQNAASIAPAVLNGQLQFGTAATPPFLSAVGKKLPLKAVASGADVPATASEDPSALLVAKGSPITRPKDLEGKTVAVNALSAMLELVAKEAIERDGGDPSKVKFVALAFPEMVSALNRGDVDAVSIVEPFFSSAMQTGAKEIANPYTAALKPGGTYVVYFASNALISSDPETVDKFSRAIDKASTAAAKDPQKVRDVMKKYGNMSEEVVSGMRLPGYSTGIDTEALAKTVEVMERQGFLPAGSVKTDETVVP